MRPRANGRQSANDIFKFIFVNEKCYILIQISLEYVPDGPISNNSELHRPQLVVHAVYH